MSGRRTSAILLHELRLTHSRPIAHHDPRRLSASPDWLPQANVRAALNHARLPRGERSRTSRARRSRYQRLLHRRDDQLRVFRRTRLEHLGPSPRQQRDIAEIVIGKALPFLAVSVAQFLVIFAIGIPLFHLHSHGPLAALVPLVAAFAICLVTLGVMITSVCHTIQQVSALAFGGLVLFGALGGALVPLEVLPGWAHAVAPATPTYWVMRGFGSVILNGHSFPAIVLPCLILIGMSLAFAAISLRRFRFTDPKVSF